MKGIFKVGLAFTLLAVLLGACTAGNTDQVTAAGKLEIRVTDAPARPEVTGVWVTLDSVEVHKAGPESSPTASPTVSPTVTPTETPQDDSDNGDWLSLSIVAGMETFNLFELKDLEEVLIVSELAPGRYTQIRMNIESVSVSLNNATPQPAEFPSGKLKFVHPFEIVAGQTTALVFDFDAEKSVNVTGNDKVLVKPVIKLTTDSPSQIPVTVEGTVTATDGVLSTVTILPDGATEPIVINVNAQTQITVDDVAVTITGLVGLGAGNTVAATYYQNNLKATVIDAVSPPTV